jgi:hypothetical protein
MPSGASPSFVSAVIISPFTFYDSALKDKNHSFYIRVVETKIERLADS